MNVRLDGERALVTGGSRNLGRALCLALGRAGAKVAFTWSRDSDGAAETARQLQLHNCTFAHERVDVTDAAATKAFVKQLDQSWGGVDVLVNNAATTQTLPLALVEEADWDRVLDVNVKGAFLTSKACLAGMIRRRRGAIVNIGSVAGTRMVEAPVHYFTSKAALKGLTEAMAKEVARYGIRVNCLAPGLCEGGIAGQVPDGKRREYLEHAALGRPATFGEIAAFAVFLASGESSYTSGATVAMDGGL